MKKPHIPSRPKMLIAWIDGDDKVHYISNMNNKHLQLVKQELEKKSGKI